jgi:hypothetical protein
VKAVLNAGVCSPDTTVTFRYDSANPRTDFSRAVTLEPVPAGPGPTRIFEAVYTGFEGIEVSDPSPGCLESVAVLTNLDRLPLLLSAQLPPGWASQPQYQRIIRVE